MAGGGLALLHIWVCTFGLASSSKVLDKSLLGPRSTQNYDDDTIDVSARGDLQDKRKLIICNAYAHTRALDVINLRSQRMFTQEGPLSYKSCHDFQTRLLEGDRLEFKDGNASVGIFTAKGIPRARSALLLIPFRRNTSALNAVFESHVFADTGRPQLAIIDTYRGKEVSKVKIMDTQSAETREEELRFNTVVGVNAGTYQVLLQSDSQQDIAKESLQVTTNQANYIVMRTGLQDTQDTTGGPSFPQELVVYGEQQSSNSLASAPLRLSVLALTITGLAVAVL